MLNIGRFGTSDAAGTLSSPTIAFGVGSGRISFNQSDTTTISSAISGTVAIYQLGSGTTILTGHNTYAGTTSVSAGSLLINGNQSAVSGAVLVAAGDTIGGSGTTGGGVTVDGILSPGNFTSVTSTGFYAGTWSLASGAWSLESGGQTLSFTPSTGDLVVTVPEPATCIMALAGLACGGISLRRRRWACSYLALWGRSHRSTAE